MKRFLFVIFIFLGFCLFSTSACVQKPSPDEQLSQYEKSLVAISDGVLQLFEHDPDGIWPGYDLSSQSFLVYMAPKWVLLFNAEGDVPNFSSPPKHWLVRGNNVLYHEGRYGDLAGQLVFDFEIAGTKTAAVGLPEEKPSGWEHPEIPLFGFIVHEAFHQYQHGHFGEIPWAREERYPILDRENAALAYLEMRILMDTVEASAGGDKERMMELLSLFTAVRSWRWREEGSFVTRYEQGQEIREGTARYVEMKCLDVFNSLLKGKRLAEPAATLEGPFGTLAFPHYLLEDFRERMAENHISPGNMLRNRIYPVGAALGFLADDLGIDWKLPAQKAGEDFAFHRLFKDALNLNERNFAAELDRAKKLYDYPTVLSATHESVAIYQKGFEKDLKAFEEQDGTRFELAFFYRGLSRSRSSLGNSWVMDAGGTSLCLKYRVYTLKTDGLQLEIHDTGVLEANDWDGKHKKVSFFVPGINKIVLDGEAYAEESEREFSTFEIQGEGAHVLIEKTGRIRLQDRKIRIELGK